MTVDFRLLTLDDYEQAADMESRAFYNPPDPQRADEMRRIYAPDWTVGAFVDGKLVADVRTIPMVRRFHGATMRMGGVGPVACSAPYRRRGLAARLLTMSLEFMRDRGQVLSGLHTPHDALYQRYGWERAEAKTGYTFAPKDIRFRVRSSGGHIEGVNSDDWTRLDAVFKQKTQNSNGPLVRLEVWWRNAVLKHWDHGKLVDSDIVLWVSDDGADQGYVVYSNRALPSVERWESQMIWIRDMQALTSNAYLGLWEHILTHDLAEKINGEFHPDDKLRQLCEDPFKVRVEGGDGAMLRVVDVEQAFAQRPFVGMRPAGFTLQIEDRNLPWNNGVWRIEGAEGQMRAERTKAGADAETSVNILASLFTGFMKPQVAAGIGLLRINRSGALVEMEQAFAVLDPPFSPDYY